MLKKSLRQQLYKLLIIVIYIVISLANILLAWLVTIS